METFLMGLGLSLAALAALLLVASAVALWEHRARVAERRAQWVVSDDDIRAFQAHAQAVDARLLEVTAAVQSQTEEQQQPTLGDASAAPNEQHERRATLRNAMRRMTDGLPPASSGRPRRLPSSATAKPAVPEEAARPTAIAQAAAVVSNGLALFSSATHGRWEETQPMVLTSHPVHFDPTVAEHYSTQ
jgi:hypothetical protein